MATPDLPPMARRASLSRKGDMLALSIVKAARVPSVPSAAGRRSIAQTLGTTKTRTKWWMRQFLASDMMKKMYHL